MSAITVGQLGADDLGGHYRIHTGDGVVEGQLWRVEHTANKFEESTFGQAEPTYHAGQTHTTVEVGDFTGTLTPDKKCEAIA